MKMIFALLAAGAVGLYYSIAKASPTSADSNTETPPEGSSPGAGFNGPGITTQKTGQGRVYTVWTYFKPGLTYRVARLAGSTLWIAFTTDNTNRNTPAKTNASGTILNTLKSDWQLPV